MANPLRRAADVQLGPRYEASFHGASASRLFYDWAVAPLSPDSETQYALADLRARARDLVRNNPYATGIVEAFADNIIGWDPGIRLKPRVLLPTGEPARDINWRIEAAWNDWGAPENCSVDGQDSWTDIQRLIVKTWVTDGEIFIRKRRGFENPYAFALQLIDADLLDANFNQPPNADGIRIRQGIEMDRDGRRLAYHFFKNHPSEDRSRERSRVAADEIIHFFVRYRAGQTRGFSLFAPVLTTVKMIDGLSEAELVASRMSAAKMGFIKNIQPPAVEAHAARLALLNDEGEDAEARLTDVAPGVLEELLPGQEFQGFDPTHPNSAFDAFLQVMLRGVSRGFSMSYLTLTGDVGAANYSSMRAGLLPERDHWRILQLATAGKVHRPVYRGFLGGALLTGALQLPTSVPTDYLAHKWRPRGWKWVDPVKDLMALELAIALGVDSRQHGAAEQGRDFEEVVDEIREELEYAAEQGVDVSGTKGTNAASNPMEIPGDDEDGSTDNGNGRGTSGAIDRRAVFLNRLHQLMEASDGQD